MIKKVSSSAQVLRDKRLQANANSRCSEDSADENGRQTYLSPIIIRYPPIFPTESAHLSAEEESSAMNTKKEEYGFDETDGGKRRQGCKFVALETE